MHVEHADGDPLGTDPIYHEAWFITADSTGNFTTSWYVPSIVEGDAYGATLLLTAHGDLGSEASWIFTDSGNFDYSTTSGKSNSVSIISGATDSSTLSVDVKAPKNNGTFNASLNFTTQSGTTIGIGVGAGLINLTSITNSYITGSNNNASDITHIFPITVTVGASVPNGVYKFQAVATSSTGNPTNNKEWLFEVVVGNTIGPVGTVTVGSQSGVSV